MIKRPKPGDEEDDVLRMQEEFLNEKIKNPNLQPAAQVTNLRSTVAQATKRPSPNESGTRKPSKYAQNKGLKNNTGKRSRTDATGHLMGDILEKNFEESHQVLQDEDDKVYYPNVIPSVLGDIVEKNIDSYVDVMPSAMPAQGFPVAHKRDQTPDNTKKNSTAFMEERDSNNKLHKMDIDSSSSSTEEKEATLQSINLPKKSFILKCKEANDIHSENVNTLSKMSEEEILHEQQKLLANMDPKLVEFLKGIRSRNTINNESVTNPLESKIVEEKMDTSEPLVHQECYNDSLWENDVLSHPNVNEWLHCDVLEKDKLEWMKGIEECKQVKPDELYEARFDFKGYLLPYTMNYTEETKTLFHHGEEPHRPGYSLTELFQLSRSTLTQQRAMALNTIAGLVEFYTLGTYKGVIELPLSKIFFVIRYSMDENIGIILESAFRAMRNLICNRIDEASLDSLLGFEEGTIQPSLENDKSEIEELDSKEVDLKDFHLAEIDIIATLLRTDILQRIHYTLDSVKPSFNCVQYALQILTRLARESAETANRIVQMDYLMTTIVKHFIPTTTINFLFNPQIVYNGKPILAALKLIRVLSLQSKDIADVLVSKYNILKPVSEYISSDVDGTYGLQIQIESFCILSNVIQYNVGVENAMALCPVIMTTLHKHVHGTNIYITSSITSITHAAVVLQLVNKLLNCKLLDLENYKPKIYLLLTHGVQKWCEQLSHSNNYTCGHLRPLCAALDCCRTILQEEQMSIKFLNDSLKMLSKSQCFKKLTNHLIQSSNLLSGIEKKDCFTIKNLKSLGGAINESGQLLIPILNVASPLPFLASLFKLLGSVAGVTTEGFLANLLEYLRILSAKVPSLCDNWFTRIETDLVLSILKISIQKSISESQKDMLYEVASKLCYILRSDKRDGMEFLFNTVIFNKHWFTAERLMNLVSLSDAEGFSKALSSIDDIKQCYSKVIKLGCDNTGPNIQLSKWQEPILPRDWIYLPILNLYSKTQEKEDSPRVIDEHRNKIATEKESIIRCSLEWILFNELCFPDLLADIDITDRFCRIMCVFLCDNSLFLDAKIKLLLHKCVQTLFKKEKTMPFNFDKPLTGLNNFQDFYTQFLEQFQSVSYGDSTFAACVLVPLAQKHNVKWRKLLWSEYAGCLGALDCDEQFLCYHFNDYCFPLETDMSLIKSYSQALCTNLLRPKTISFKIARYHVQSWKIRLSTFKNLIGSIE